MGGEEQNFPVDSAFIRQPGGNLRDQHEAVFLVLFAVEQAEKLAELLVLIEGAQVITRIRHGASAKRRHEHEDREKACCHLGAG